MGIGTAAQSGATSAGITVAGIVTGATNNYGIYIGPPSGGTGNNIGLFIAGGGANITGGLNVANGLTIVSGVATCAGGAVFAGTTAGAAAGQVGVGGVIASTVGGTGSAAALPANPLGYWQISIPGGTLVKVPYYSN